MPVPTEFIYQNPWWKNPEAIEDDKYIAALKESKVPWDTRLKYKFERRDIVYTLRGPRQVGKTTLLKDMIRDLINSGVSPRSIFYYTCDLIDNPKGLVETVSKYLDSIRSSSDKRVYIFLDEVSSIRDWQKAIKYLADTGKLISSRIILTGSHTLDIKKASEKLPGRRGVSKEVPDKIMLPMKFAEYVETLNKEIRKVIRELWLLSWEKRKKLFLSLVNGEIPEEIKELSFFSKELQLLFQNYLFTGGTPRVIDDYLKNELISESVYRTYVDVVRGDLARWGKKESYLRQLLFRVVESLGNPVGWNTLKHGTDIASHNTVAEYIDVLRDNFVLLYLHCYDMSRNGPAYQKEKKIYFQDPFFLHAMKAWTSGREPFSESIEFLRVPENLGVLTEGVVANHLVRLSFSLSEQKQLFDYENVFFYWRSKKGREIDFILMTGEDMCVPIEVKYQSEINRSDCFGLLDFVKISRSLKGIMLSKDKLEVRRKITTVPVWLFLLLI